VFHDNAGISRRTCQWSRSVIPNWFMPDSSRALRDVGGMPHPPHPGQPQQIS
jgi:hypothetical protein